MINFGKKYTEQDLIADCKKGKRQAQQKLYELYSSKMLGVCHRYLPKIEEAEDVMIHGFMKVFTHLESYQGAGSFEGWIRRIMINESLTALRKKQNIYFEPVETAFTELDNQSTDLNLQMDDLMNIINTLPTGYRTVFNLYAIEGYSHKEIGEMLGITESTSKSQLNRARTMIQKKIAELTKIEC
jgi:RNA polymerase sigma-70 factor (ECF subfamily)